MLEVVNVALAVVAAACLLWAACELRLLRRARSRRGGTVDLTGLGARIGSATKPRGYGRSAQGDDDAAA